MLTAAATTPRPLVVLAEHVGHRLNLPEPLLLRCFDCNRNIDLRSLIGLAELPPSADQPTCPAHPGEHAHACRCCRAERLGRPDSAPVAAKPTTADHHAGVAACRAALAGRKGRQSS